MLYTFSKPCTSQAIIWRYGFGGLETRFWTTQQTLELPKYEFRHLKVRLWTAQSMVLDISRSESTNLKTRLWTSHMKILGEGKIVLWRLRSCFDFIGCNKCHAGFTRFFVSFSRHVGLIVFRVLYTTRGSYAPWVVSGFTYEAYRLCVYFVYVIQVVCAHNSVLCVYKICTCFMCLLRVAYWQPMFRISCVSKPFVRLCTFHRFGYASHYEGIRMFNVVFSGFSLSHVGSYR